ncbi:hypothetical protein QVD17_11747 [Tagetes erecta]|uniref:Transmembrane protein n=1 Tax=Tagetes erecta TaxID=13708 RepID=A0AAD8KYJ6_TARER|nr:hypothetical protein QVD17_11747 [Tagetes erecta]
MNHHQSHYVNEFSSSNSDLSIWADVIVWSNKAEDFKIKRRVLHQERRSIVLLLFRFASFVFLLIRDCRFLLLCLVSWFTGLFELSILLDDLAWMQIE